MELSASAAWAAGSAMAASASLCTPLEPWVGGVNCFRYEYEFRHAAEEGDRENPYPCPRLFAGVVGFVPGAALPLQECRQVSRTPDPGHGTMEVACILKKTACAGGTIPAREVARPAFWCSMRAKHGRFSMLIE